MMTLVGYATAKGSTREIAERLAAALGSADAGVDLMPLHQVKSVREYDTLVIGSAIHNGRWLPDATEAIERLGATLSGRVVWAYSVSSVGATSTILSARVASYLRRHTPEPDAVQKLRTTAEVRDHRAFAGAIAPGDWPRLGRIVFRLMGGRYGDARDWTDIEAWASTIGRDIAQNRR